MSEDAEKAAAEDHRKHLELIQAVIARLASSSAFAKTWSVTLSAAAFAFAVLHPEKWQIAFVVTGLVVFLAVLDSRYLHQERLFRRLYESARTGDVDVFSMDKDSCRPTVTLWSAIASWSILGFYGPLFAVGFVLLGVARASTA